MRLNSAKQPDSTKNPLTVPADFDIGSHDVDAEPVTGKFFFRLSKVLDLLPFQLCQVKCPFYTMIQVIVRKTLALIHHIMIS